MNNYVIWISALVNKYMRPPDGSLPSAALPFSAPPPLSSYSHHAVISGIMAATAPNLPYFSNYYINLRSPLKIGAYAKGGDSLLNIEPTITVERLGAAGFADWRSMGPDLPKNCIAEICKALMDGYYVIAIVDKFYLPGMSAYLKKSDFHWIVIVGYDKAADRLAIAGYDKSGNFNACSVDRSLMTCALQSAGVRSFATRPGVFRLQFFKPDLGLFKNLDYRLMARQMRDFINSENTNYEYMEKGLCNPIAPANVVYGLKCYEILQSHLIEWLEEGQDVDLRATKVVLEHEILMYLRVAALMDAGLPAEFANLREMCRAARAAARELHMRAVSWMLQKQNPKPNLNEMSGLVDVMKQSKEQIMPDLIKQLEAQG